MAFQMTPDTDTRQREAELMEQEGRVSLAAARGALLSLLFLPVGAAIGIFNWVAGGAVELTCGLLYLFFIVKVLVFGVPARRTRVGRRGLILGSVAIALPCGIHWFANAFFFH